MHREDAMAAEAATARWRKRGWRRGGVEAMAAAAAAAAAAKVTVAAVEAWEWLWWQRWRPCDARPTNSMLSDYPSE